MKNITLITVMIFACAMFANEVMAQTTTIDEGVKINGVVWATRNVDAPGTFAENPEEAGMFYQWNKKVGWTSSGTAISTDGSSWNSSWNGNLAETWETSNDVCPTGWRIPTYDDFMTLAQANQEQATENGQIGRKFTDQTTNNSVFFPIVGYRCWQYTTVLDLGVKSFYWTTTTDGILYDRIQIYRAQISNTAVFSNSVAGIAAVGLNVRCVKDHNAIYNLIVPPMTNGTIEISQPTATTGDILTFTVTPNEGYELESISITHENGTSVTIENLSFIMPDGNVTITAVFKPIYTAIVAIPSREIKSIMGYYNTLGQKLSEEPQKGIYIILYDNGTSEKVIKNLK